MTQFLEKISMYLLLSLQICVFSQRPPSATYKRGSSRLIRGLDILDFVHIYLTIVMRVLSFLVPSSLALSLDQSSSCNIPTYLRLVSHSAPLKWRASLASPFPFHVFHILLHLFFILATFIFNSMCILYCVWGLIFSFF